MPAGPGPAGGGAPKIEPMAIVSLVCGILSFVCCLCCNILGAPVPLAALVTGFLSMQKINKDPQTWTGKGFAIAGMATGGLALLLMIGYLIYALVTGTFSATPRGLGNYNF